MTSSQIANFLKSPHLINEQDLPVLEKSIEAYPFVGLFHMLYLKGLHNTKSIYFDKALSRAALVINDRVKLHQILYSTETPVKKVNLIKESVDIPIETQPDSLMETSIPEVKFIETELDEEMQLLHDNIVTEAIDHTIQIDVDTLLEEDFTEVTTDGKDIISEIKEDNAVEEPKSFGDWLNVMVPADQPTDKRELLSPLKSSKELIDQFIASANKRIKVSNQTPESLEIASKSIEDKNDFATETLAQVYAGQKKYNKAIEIYELLALKFPEKKTFFASRIRFLREKMEYDN